MKFRYAILAVWVGITAWIWLRAISDAVFGKRRHIVQRIALGLIWPLAMLSAKGRDKFFKGEFNG